MKTRQTIALVTLLLSAACAGTQPAGRNGGTLIAFGEPEGLVFGMTLYSSATADFPSISGGSPSG